MLLVGDPGMGKSQFLRYAARAAPRAVLTTGTGSTAAGLTAAAVRSESDAGGGSSSRGDESRWTLEAGALVLADGGACCVDEFDTIAPGERAAIHEAMEQQTLSVAKAGIVATLRARCAVLAATNPRGFAFDPQRSLAENTGLAPPLLSRFDCVLVLRDERDPERDERAATHMLASHRGVRATGAAEPHILQDQSGGGGRGHCLRQQARVHSGACQRAGREQRPRDRDDAAKGEALAQVRRGHPQWPGQGWALEIPRLFGPAVLPSAGRQVVPLWAVRGTRLAKL